MEGCFSIPHILYSEFGNCHEEKMSVVLASFKKKKLWRATTKGEGGRFPLSFLKIEKKYSNLGKIAMFVCFYGLNYHLKCGFKNILGKKQENCYLRSPSFVCRA